MLLHSVRISDNQYKSIYFSLKDSIMRYPPPPPPQLKRLTVLAAALVALTLATSAQAQSCTRSTCAVTIKNVSPVADGCGEHATPARMSITWASTRSVTYNEGKTGRYAILFPPRTANNVPVDPADETRSRSDFPASINLTPSTIDPMTNRPGSKFTDWEWRNPNISGGRWKAAPDNLVGIPSQVGEHIFEVRPTAGAASGATRARWYCRTLQYSAAAGFTPQA